MFPSLIYIVVCINTSLKNIFIHFICIVLFVHHVYVLFSEEEGTGSPELELWIFVSRHVGAETKCGFSAEPSLQLQRFFFFFFFF